MSKEKTFIFTDNQRPKWVKYPRGYTALVECGSVKFPPWLFMETAAVVDVAQQLKTRYSKDYFPIAWLEGTDDFACLEKDAGDKIFRVNCYATPGHEIVFEYKSFWQWLHAALEEMENQLT